MKNSIECIKNDLVKKIAIRGSKIANTIEILNTNFICTYYNGKLNSKQEKYLKDKINEWKDQIDLCIKRLKEDRNSRRAVIIGDIKQKYPDCIVAIHFLIRNERLYTIVFSRAMDVENKMIQDIKIVSEIVKIIARNLKVKKSGFINWTVGSLHYYV